MANSIKVTVTHKGRPLAQVQKDFNAALKLVITDIGAQFKIRAVVNTSIDKTPLRKSIKWTAAVSNGVATALITASTSYAFKVHEQHDDKITTRQFREGRGPGGTASQPWTKEGGPGGAYFRRVSDFWARHYKNFSIDALDASLRNKPRRVNLPIE